MSRLDEWDTMVDGDDALLFFPARHLEWVLAELGPSFLRFGHEVVPGKLARHWTEVEYGKARPIWAGDWRLGRDPMAVLSSTFVSNKYYGNPVSGRRFARTVAQGALVVNRGVPVLQAFAEAALGQLGPGPVDPSMVDPEMLRTWAAEGGAAWMEVTAAPVTLAARQAYAVAWGIDIDSQRYLEQRLLSGEGSSLQTLRLVHEPGFWCTANREAVPVEDPPSW